MLPSTLMAINVTFDIVDFLTNPVLSLYHWNRPFHHHTHKSLPLELILSQINPVHSLSQHFIRPFYILPTFKWSFSSFLILHAVPTSSWQIWSS
jgi:hypothetical protein